MNKHEISPDGISLPRRAAAASFFGSMVEWYDFFIYGSASALIFGHVFLSNLPTETGTIISLGTFAAAYLARPAGSFIVGHLGDRIGRKRVLVISLWSMGGATVLIGCLPDYATIGVTAPILLLLLRVVQGLSASGEQGGAASLAFEHSPNGKRAFYTSFTLAGTVAGLLLGNVAFIPVAALPDEELYSWGWRLPFLASAVVVVVASLVRQKLVEPPEFELAKQRNETEKFPLVVFLRHYWKQFFIVMFGMLFAAVFTAFNVFALNYAPAHSELTSSSMLWAIVISNALMMLTIPLWAKVSDRIGRKPVFIFGTLGLAVSIFAYFLAISTSSWPLVLAAGTIMISVFYSAPNGTYISFFLEMFDARVRFTGIAVSTSFGALLQGFVPSISAVITLPGDLGWWPVATLLSGLCLISALAVSFARETAHLNRDRLGAGQRLSSAGAPREAMVAVEEDTK